MPNRVIGKCPVCRQELTVTRLKCPSCSTEISGDFHPCAFCRLDPDQENLVSVFLKNRGNIREVERDLGISYPTVRGRLDDVMRVLGLTPKKKAGGRSKGAVEVKEAEKAEGEGPNPSG